MSRVFFEWGKEADWVYLGIECVRFSVLTKRRNTP